MEEDTSNLAQGPSQQAKRKAKAKSVHRVRMHLPPAQTPSRAGTPPPDLSLSADGELSSARPGFPPLYPSEGDDIPLVDMSRQLEEGYGGRTSHDSEEHAEAGPSSARESMYGTPFSSGSNTPYETGTSTPRRRWDREIPGFPWESMRQLLLPKKHGRGQSVANMGDPFQRQDFCMKLCRALMMNGAPTHRLEQCMKTTARHLRLEAQFLYLPACMICSFDDRDLRSTEVKLVRAKEGLNFEKLTDVVNIYKEVVHDTLDVDEAVLKLDTIMERPDRRGPWTKVLIHGAAAATVGPFAFGARPIDLPPIFALGCGVGFLQNMAAAKSEGFSSLFEVTAALATAFASRGLGSIRWPGVDNSPPIFCFSAMAQSAIALILPGYIILSASLELQNRNIVAGSVRMVYAIIYSLMLGFGTLIGAVLYGVMDKNATSAVTCSPAQGTLWWDKHIVYIKIPFVLLFTLCLTTINQAKMRWEMFVMLVLACVGFLVSSYSQRKFENNVQVASALGACVVGVLGNGYSRYSSSIGAVILMPAIFVQVPSGIAAGGSLLSGLTSADQITGGNETAKADPTRTAIYGGTTFNLGFGMVQVALGISVGLLFSSYVLFPFGKKRSGVFSF